jgi:hypothetical protein
MTSFSIGLDRRGALALALAVPGLLGCQQMAASGNRQGPRVAAASPCGRFAPTPTSALPKNSTASNQAEMDCDAWQAFIALNWRADPAKRGYPDPTAAWGAFGTARDTSPTVWESYQEAASVFGSGDGVLKGQWQQKLPAVKSLRRISKFGDLDLKDITQAGGDHWLTNQRGDITYYEVLMNRDEYEFITTQKGFDLTTAQGQLDCASQPGKPASEGTPVPHPPLRGGLSLPSGTANGWIDTDCIGNGRNWGDGVGAMEVKAAWTPLPADHSLDYRYKTAVAEIEDPVTKSLRQVTVGLVGLHVIRKTISRQQWTWATFEQIDNSPDDKGQNGYSPPALPPNPNPRGPFPGFTYFNTNCIPQKDPVYGCRHNFPPRPCGSGGVCMPYNKPMQITRLNPVGEPANSVTGYVWSLLPARSVFNYYRLINVQWPQDVKKLNYAQQRLPLQTGNPTPPVSPNPFADPPLPPGRIVANTALESFQQRSNSCLDCHSRYAQIYYKNLRSSGPGGRLRKVPRPAGGTAPGLYASDYSFLFVTETKR